MTNSMRLQLNITGKLVGYLLVAGIVPLLVYGVSAFQVARSIVIDQASEHNLRIASNVAAYLRLYRSQVEDMAASIAGNDAIAIALNEVDVHAVSSYDALNANAQIGYLLNNFVRVKGLVSIDLFSLKGKHFHIGDTLDVSDVALGAVQRMASESEQPQSAAFWRGIEDNINTSSAHKKVITLTRLIRHFSAQNGGDQTVGLLVVNLNDEIFRDYSRNQGNQNGIRLMVTDRYGKLMYHDDHTLTGLPLTPELLALAHDSVPTHQLQLDGEDVIVTTIPIPNIDGYLFFAAPTALQTAGVSRLATSGVALLLACLIGIAGLVRHYAKTVVAPLRAVSDGFDRLRELPGANQTPLQIPEKKDEISNLITGFNEYIESLSVQRSADARLKHMEQSALESAHILRAAIDAVDTAFAVFDAQDRLVFCNEQFRYVYQTEDVSAASISSFEQIIRSNAERGIYPDAMGRLPKWIEERLALYRAGQTDMEQKLSDGRWLRVVERQTPSGHTVSLAVDITYLKNMHEAAQAANFAKSAFLANMSHEIRTPMNAILGMAHLLQLEGVSPKQKEHFDKINTAAQHLLGIINDILDLSKIEAGKFVLEETPVVLSSLLENVRSIMSGRAKAKGVHLLIETEYSPQRLVGDAMRLQQALLNYATNAIKFTEKGTVTLRTLLQVESIDSIEVRFEVQDTGIGIAPQAMSRLFNVFEQADNSMSRKYGGTGLGLAITQRLAQLMGGQAGAQSTPGVGSIFWFTVKLQKDVSDETATPTRVWAPAVDAKSMIRQRYADSRILIVDDEPINREVVQRLLESVDLVVDAAANGEEAVVLARLKQYRVILMDIQMPRLNGLQTTQEIRKLPGFQSTPIVALTANVFAEDRLRCATAGMHDFLVKPFNPDELFAAILRSLNSHSQSEV